MRLTIEKEYEFIPEAYGNKEDSTPVVFRCRALTETQRDKCFETEFVDGVSHFYTRQERLFRFAVVGIDNLDVNGKAITNAKEFMTDAPSLSQMFDEVVSEIIVRTTRPDLKNS